MTTSRPNRLEYTEFPLPLQSFNAWSIARVRSAIAQHEVGDFANSALLFQAMERNPRIMTALNTRVYGLIGADFDLKAGNGDGRRNETNCNKLRPYWSTIAPTPVTATLLRWVLGLGVAFAEKVWRTMDGQWIPVLKPWHPSFFYYNPSLKQFFVSTTEGLIPIEKNDPHWVVIGYTDQQPWLRGVVRCLGFEDAVRGDVVRDWARYSELHGVPTTIAVVPEEAPLEEKRRFLQDVANRGSASVILTPKNSEGEGYGLDIVEPVDQSWQAFDMLLKYLDSDVEIALLGQAFSTEQKSGVYTAKGNATGVRQDYKEADERMFSTVYHDQVTVDWARYNIGPDLVDTAPYCCWDVCEESDKKLEADTLLVLGQAIAAINVEARKVGKEVNLEALLEQYDVPLRVTKVADPAPVMPATVPTKPPTQPNG